jgi:hypothetical protein
VSADHVDWINSRLHVCFIERGMAPEHYRSTCSMREIDKSRLFLSHAEAYRQRSLPGHPDRMTVLLTDHRGHADPARRRSADSISSTDDFDRSHGSPARCA